MKKEKDGMKLTRWKRTDSGNGRDEKGLNLMITDVENWSVSEAMVQEMGKRRGNERGENEMSHKGEEDGWDGGLGWKRNWWMENVAEKGQLSDGIIRGLKGRRWNGNGRDWKARAWMGMRIDGEIVWRESRWILMENVMKEE